jgi:hypothetical protein
MKKSFDFIQAENEFRFPSSMNGWQSLFSVILSKLCSFCLHKQASKQRGSHFYISDWDASASVCCRVGDVSVWCEREHFLLNSNSHIMMMIMDGNGVLKM